MNARRAGGEVPWPCRRLRRGRRPLTYTDGRLDVESLARFVGAYKAVNPLPIGPSAVCTGVELVQLDGSPVEGRVFEVADDGRGHEVRVVLGDGSAP